MAALDHLRQRIKEQEQRLVAAIPGDRDQAIIALIRALARQVPDPLASPEPDLVTGHRLAAPGANKALHLCLNQSESPIPGSTSYAGTLDAWATEFLAECSGLALAELACSHCEQGFMRMVEDDSGTCDAWIATRTTPSGWLERVDIDWWSQASARQYRPGASDVQTGYALSDPVAQATARLGAMAWQPGLPPGTVIHGISIQSCHDVLKSLLCLVLESRASGVDLPAMTERELTERLQRAGLSPETDPGPVLPLFTVHWENAGWHAAVPGIAAAPLVRLDTGQIVISPFGLLTEPLLFLSRELRRRYPDDYRNAAAGREATFRDDLCALFPGSRFAHGASPIKLRTPDSRFRTDIDAAIFDRKSGTLAVFELKSHDPFARSGAEANRQRDNILAANRQVSSVLDWINRHGPDEILNRIDSRIARRFRVQKVLSFVLGRYVAHVGDPAALKRRAAWGTWPQVLRLMETTPIKPEDANPLGALHSRLMNERTTLDLPESLIWQEIRAGELDLRIHASRAAFQNYGRR